MPRSQDYKRSSLELQRFSYIFHIQEFSYLQEYRNIQQKVFIHGNII